MSFTLVEVRGSYRTQDASGAITAAKGSVDFQLRTALQRADDDLIVSPIRLAEELDANGALSIQLVATDDPGVQPQGVTYTVTERIQGAPARVYDIEIPMAAAGAGLELADLAPSISEPTFSYVSTSTFDAYRQTADGSPMGLFWATGTADDRIEVLAKTKSRSFRQRIFLSEWTGVVPADMAAIIAAGFAPVIPVFASGDSVNTTDGPPADEAAALDDVEEICLAVHAAMVSARVAHPTMPGTWDLVVGNEMEAGNFWSGTNQQYADWLQAVLTRVRSLGLPIRVVDGGPSSGHLMSLLLKHGQDTGGDALYTAYGAMFAENATQLAVLEATKAIKLAEGADLEDLLTRIAPIKTDAQNHHWYWRADAYDLVVDRLLGIVGPKELMSSEVGAYRAEGVATASADPRRIAAVAQRMLRRGVDPIIFYNFDAGPFALDNTTYALTDPNPASGTYKAMRPTGDAWVSVIDSLRAPVATVELRPQQLEVLFWATSFALNNAPAAETEIQPDRRRQVDLTGMTQARVVGRMSAAGAAGAQLRAQYSADAGATWADLGPSRGAAGIDTFAVAGAWAPVPFGARADVILRFVMTGGDGVADPAFTLLGLQFRP